MKHYDEMKNSCTQCKITCCWCQKLSRQQFWNLIEAKSPSVYAVSSTVCKGVWWWGTNPRKFSRWMYHGNGYSQWIDRILHTWWNKGASQRRMPEQRVAQIQLYDHQVSSHISPCLNCQRTPRLWWQAQAARGTDRTTVRTGSTVTVHVLLVV